MDKEDIVKMAREVGIPTGRIGGYDKELKRFADLVAAAVAEPEQEPVAWITDGGKGELWWYQSSKFDEEGNLIGPNPDDIPLYTAPQKQWVGLTEREAWDAIDDVREGGLLDVARAVEAKLREKNHG